MKIQFELSLAMGTTPGKALTEFTEFLLTDKVWILESIQRNLQKNAEKKNEFIQIPLEYITLYLKAKTE